MAAMTASDSQGPAQHWATRTGALLALLLSSAFFLTNAITDVPFHTKGEPREALVIQSMFEHHEYVLPLRNGNEIPSKPPLFHWLGTIAAHSIGEATEVAARLPSVMSALALIAMTALLGFRWWGTVAGLVAGVALLTCQQFIASATTARVDMVLAAGISATVALTGVALAEHRRIPLFVYFTAALSVLAKGPVGYALPGAIIAAYLAAQRRIPPLSHLRIGPGVLIALTPLLWYLAAWWMGGQDFLDKLVFKENVYRVLDPDSVQAGHVKPVWFYGPALLGSTAPWSLYLPAIVLQAWRRRGSLEEDHLLLPLIWIVVTIVLFSLSPSKRPVYLLPCYPAIALLVGQWVASQGSANSAGRATRIAATVITVALSLPIALIALQAVGIPTIGWIKPLVSAESDRSNLVTLIGVAESMRAPLLLWAVTSTVLLAAATRFTLNGRRQPAFVAVASLIVLTVSLAGLPMQREMAKRQSVLPFVDRVRTKIAAEEAVFFYRGLDYSTAYYLRRPVPPVEDVRAGEGRNRTWYFVWEQSVGNLCSQVRALRSDAVRYRCREHERDDFFDNPAREDLVLISSTPRRVAGPTK
jgi:4-amino-4-deoxy-L-arabinose transferase-like glycosyltransferase